MWGSWDRFRASGSVFRRWVVATLCFATAFAAIGLLLPRTWGTVAYTTYFVVLLVVAFWTGRAASTGRFGFLAGLACGWCGFVLGLLVVLPVEAIEQSEGTLAALLGAALAAVVALLFGLVLGFLVGLLGGLAGYLGARLTMKESRAARS